MTSFQSQVFLNSLGDEWLDRNRADLTKKVDDVEFLIDRFKIQPKAILELGCANGWRLNKLQKKYNCAILGIDPSNNAIIEAEANAERHPSFIVGTADQIPTRDETFDVIILGFCLWCIAPEDWFKIVHETTRVLKDGGFLIINDYITPRPYKRLYAIEETTKTPIFTYMINWPSLWLSHPGYKEVGERLNTGHWEIIRTSKWELTCIIQKRFTETVMILNEE